MLLTLAGCGERDAAHVAASPRVHDDGVTPCPGARVVGVLDESSDAAELGCDLGGAVLALWRGVRLFEHGSPGVAALDQPAPGELRSYCSYEWTGAGPAELDELLAVLDASPHMGAETVGLDCGVSSGRGQLDSGIATALHASFRRDIGWLSGDALGSSQAVRMPIEVAIVDSVSQRVADDPELEPSDPHGTAMAALVADIMCPDRRAECRENIRHTLALPRADAERAPDWLRGGPALDQ